MLFTEFRFLAFFVLAFAVHWVLRSSSLRKLWLLMASYAFYMAWDWRFLGLILLSTVVDGVCGARIARSESPGARKALLVTSLAVNLGILGLYKYFDFFSESAALLLEQFGFQANPTTLDLLLPVGISFYTFQTLSYTLDIYKGSLKPARTPLDLALFVAFFPQLVAGPIVRASEFLPQLERPRRWDMVRVRFCAVLFLIGYVKKACLADHAAGAIDPVFADPAAFDTASNWLALALYTIQIYGDFSGYSDMAIATAGLLGYALPLNFNFPFVSRNMAEFWQRWHITLSGWLRDYLYMPLRGSSRSNGRKLAAGVTTMMLCGLWHGAGWQYLGFGVLMSLSIVVSAAWSGLVAEGSALRRTVTFLGPAIVLWFLFLNWMVFRGENLQTISDMAGIFWFDGPDGGRALASGWWWLFLGAGAWHVAGSRDLCKGWPERLPDWGFAVVFGAAFALVLPWAATGYKPFIYFQF
jgi:alginate O-acetyltransferase complex protein AlgI